MAETGIHVQAIIHLHQALQDLFNTRSDVFIASDMNWYWVEGDNTLKVAPDVMVVFGVSPYDRRSFRSFEEAGAIPSIVFEMASEGTWRNDEEGKFELYEELGVKEYYLFDPEWQYLSSQVKGYRLENSAYRKIPWKNQRLRSQFGFEVAADATMLRLYRLSTGLPILTRAEAMLIAQEQVVREQRKLAEEQRKLAEEQRKLAEEQRRNAALELEIARLRAILGQNPQAGSSS